MVDHLYIHVPFCRSKCGYCAFYSVACADEELQDRYVDAVLVEAGSRLGDRPHFKTVYLGGGTPSLLGPARIGRLLEGIADHGSLDGAEVTLEANPESVSAAGLAGLRRAGVNRISLGLQSLDDAALTYLGRAHDAIRGRAALASVQALFDRVSIDLIYGLPGQSVADWEAELGRAAALGTEHISAYELTWEPGTPLGDGPHGPDDRSDHFFATHERLSELGYHGYEVSNFARSAQACSRHNQATWAYRPYVGLGPGAHSFTGAGPAATRRWNLPDVAAYVEASRRRSVPHESEVLDGEQQRLERLMLGLRTTAGVAVADVTPPGGLSPSFDERLQSVVRRGLASLEGERLVPTLEGMGLADGLAAELTA